MTWYIVFGVIGFVLFVVLLWLLSPSNFGARILRAIEEDPEAFRHSVNRNYKYGDLHLKWCPYDHRFETILGKLGVLESRQIRFKLERQMQDRVFKKRQEERLKENGL